VSNRFHDEPPYVRYQANPRVAFTLKCAKLRAKLSSEKKRFCGLKKWLLAGAAETRFAAASSTT
jgi:hypothetical protein